MFNDTHFGKSCENYFCFHDELFIFYYGGIPGAERARRRAAHLAATAILRIPLQGRWCRMGTSRKHWLPSPESLFDSQVRQLAWLFFPKNL